jgi:hypothetical protein
MAGWVAGRVGDERASSSIDCDRREARHGKAIPSFVGFQRAEAGYVDGAAAVKTFRPIS